MSINILSFLQLNVKLLLIVIQFYVAFIANAMLNSLNTYELLKGK